MSNVLHLSTPTVNFPVYPEYPGKLHMVYYKAPLVNVKECLDETEAGLLVDIETAKAAKLFISKMKEFIAYEKTQHTSFYCSRVPYTTLPSSIMLDVLIPTKDGATSDIADVSYDLGFRFGGKMKANAEPGERELAEKLIEDANTVFVKRLLNHGIKAVIEEGLVKQYSFFTSPPSGLKKMSGYFLSSEAWKLPRIQKAAWFGLSPKEINSLTNGKVVFPKQVMQMRGLFTSSAIPSSKFFGDGRFIDPRKAIVMPKVQRILSGKVREVRGRFEKDQQEVYRTDLDRALADGQNIGNPMKFGKFVGQLRMLTFKGLDVCFDIVNWAKYRGVKPIVNDFYKVKHDLSKEDWDILITLDSWKMGKVFKSWDDCCNAAAEMGITEFYICATNSVEKMTVNVARQCWNSLFAITNEQLFPFVKPSIDKVNKADTLEGAAKLLREDFTEEISDKTGIAQCISIDEELVGIPAIWRKVAQIKESRWCKVAGGSIKLPGCSAYLVDDPGLVCDGWFGIDVNNNYAGLFRPGEVYIPDCPRKSGKISLLRYPHAYMEWAVMELKNNEWLQNWLPDHVCVVNGHDLTPRILMFDVDGDHATIVFSEELAKIAEHMRKRFNILSLYYDPKSAEGKPVGETREAFIDQAVECIVKCKAYNMVGPYSNIVRTVWTKVTSSAEEMLEKGLDCVACDGKQPVTVRTMLRCAAYAAQKVNEAVDSQKTYALDFINEQFSQAFSGTPYNQRFRDHSPVETEKNHRFDSDHWKNSLRPMNGTVDRISGFCEKYSAPELKLDIEQLKPDLSAFLDSRYMKGFQPVKSVISDDLLYDMEYIGRVNTAEGMTIMRDLQEGNASFSDLLHVLHYMYGESFSVFAKNSDDELEKSAHYVEQIRRIQNVVADYFRLADKYADMSFEEALHAAGNSALRTVMTLSKHNDTMDDKFILFLFDVFGEVWAENAENNALQ